MAASRLKAVSAIASSRLTVKGQVMVPIEVRLRLRLKAGDSILFEESESGGRIRKAQNR